jgi:hypothetical protein
MSITGLLRGFMSIEVLESYLLDVCQDDGRSPESFSLAELVSIAKNRLAEFAEDGSYLSDAIRGNLDKDDLEFASRQLNSVICWIDSACGRGLYYHCFDVYVMIGDGELLPVGGQIDGGFGEGRWIASDGTCYDFIAGSQYYSVTKPTANA